MQVQHCCTDTVCPTVNTKGITYVIYVLLYIKLSHPKKQVCSRKACHWLASYKQWEWNKAVGRRSKWRNVGGRKAEQQNWKARKVSTNWRR